VSNSLTTLPTPTREQVLAQLMQWLPGVYRARDAQGGKALQAYLSLFADELWRLRRAVAQSHADHFIDSAQDWVIPYLADLVGTEVLFTGVAAARREIAALNRDDVKNTLRWRRQKGTLAGLQDVAHGVSGWGVHAQEMFERTACVQHLSHPRPHARFALDLRDGTALAQALTPFSQARALADLRPPGQRAGWHQPRNVCVFEWPIRSHPLRGITPYQVAAGRYSFHPLGLDTALHAGCDSEDERAAVLQASGAAGADIAHVNATDTPIRTRDLRAHAAAYVATPLGFALREDGIHLLGGEAAAAASLEPCLGFAELAAARGLFAADTSAYAAGTRFELAAVRLGAVLQLVESKLVPITYSPGQALAAQLQLLNPQGRLALDTVTPDFGYTPGMAPYQPDSGEYHHAVLLLRITNTGATAAAFPLSEVIVRNARGGVLQVALPALAPLAAAASVYLYVAADGSSYFARGDHGPGLPDRNPDSSIFGAYSAPHLARASEGQRRIRPGHPVGAARFRRLVARELCCWDQPLTPPLAAGEIAIDPQRGRIAFPPGEVPAGELSVDFRLGLTATIGAGPFARGELPRATLTVARTRNASFTSVQAALNAAPDGGVLPVVIEILDSAVYEEALSLVNRNFPAGLVIQAAVLQTPLLRKPAAALQLVDIATSSVPVLGLDGLLMAGGALRITGDVGALRLRHCSLQPQSTTLDITVPTAIDVQLQQCISGPVTITAPQGRVTLQDSIVQHPAASIETPQAGNALVFANGVAALEASTLIGNLSAVSAKLSNTLCYGDVALADTSASCLRYSRLPRSLAAARAFSCTQAAPVFVSIRFGDAGYAHLHPNTAAQLLRGGEEGGEIGAFASAGSPWRTQNAGLRLTEYTPAGLVPVQIRALPRPRFRGNLRT